MNKQIIKRVMLCLLISSFFLCELLLYSDHKAQAASFDDINQDNVFVMQQMRGTCTLASATMMLRRAAMLSGDTEWDHITEETLKPTAWMEGVGLYHSFKFKGLTVGFGTISSNQKEFYIEQLQKHPEGIAIYNKSHTILLTDYTNGEFYCADPAISAKRIPISKSKQVTIESTSKYWYVVSPKVTLENISELIFDPILYADLYPELKQEFGYNETALYNHWISIGMKEGRTPSYVYQPQFYLDANPDLKETYGTDFEAIYKHFTTYGAFQNRASSPVYNAAFYKSMNLDLKNYSSVELLKQFLNNGINEYRSSSNIYDGNYYLEHNEDLKELGSKELLHHFYTTGINEFRTSSPNYNGMFYKQTKDELSQYTSFDLAMFFSNHGSLNGDKGNYIDLSSASVVLKQQEFNFTGKEIKPQLFVTYQGIDLLAGKDYTLNYQNNINVGSSIVTVTGAGNYSGEVKRTFSIKAGDLKGVSVKGNSITYDGKAYAPIVTLPQGASITYSTNGKTYSSTKPCYVNAGTYKVYYKVTKPNYKLISGSITLKITPKSISKMTVSLSANQYSYNGKARKPSVVLKDGKSIINNSNYTICYSANTNPGNASVKVTGKGNYSGTISKTFVIYPSAPKLSARSLTKAASLQWGKVTGVSGYEIYLSNSQNKNFSRVSSLGKSTLSYKKTKLISKKKYYFKVRTYTVSGGKKLYSAYSNVVSVKVK